MNARVVLLTSHLPNYRLIADWAERHHHKLVLVVTPSGDNNRRYGDDDFVAGLGSEQDVLVTSQLREIAAPAIAATAPDLIISAGFPRLIPLEILQVPAYGAVNLHPSALPAGRGPNPFRLVYEGDETLGATLHRTEVAFDTGPILSQRQRPLPVEMSAAGLRAAFLAMSAEVIEEGTANALTGEPGMPQGSAGASYAAPFTTEEELIDFSEDSAVVCRKVAALNIVRPRARFHLPGNGHVQQAGCDGTIVRASTMPFDGGAKPGIVLAAHVDGWTVQAADSAIRIFTGS